MSKLLTPSQNVLGQTDDIPAVMNVESSVLEPIICTDTNCRWVLNNAGILSRDSVIQFQLTVPTAQSGIGFLPTSAGIYGLIRSATLRIGARKINTIEDAAFFKAMTHSYDTPSYRTNRTRILKGINTTVLPTPSAPNVAAGGKFILAGSDLVNEGQVEQDYQMRLTDSADTTPCWSIRLAELFPILWDIELPLFLLKDEVAIDLTFRTQKAADVASGGVGTLCCFEDSGAGSPANMILATCSLVKSSCLLYQDLIYYVNERMEEIASAVNAKDGFLLDYTDVIQNVAHHANAGGGAGINIGLETNMTINNKTDQVPLSGFRCKNLFFAETVPEYHTITNNPVTAPPATYRYFNQFLGKYALWAYHEDSTWDLRVNDILTFPQPVKSATLKAAEAENVYGSPVWLNQAQYSYNPVTTKSGLFPTPATSSLFPLQAELEVWGKHMNANWLQGSQHFSAINLSHGWGDDNDDSILLGQKPLEVLHSSMPVNSSSNYNRTMYYYAEVVKRFGVKDGQAVVYQQPAVDVR